MTKQEADRRAEWFEHELGWEVMQAVAILSRIGYEKEAK